ncbi:hypothetical protein C8P63_12223 [Melghirimyces profundicolus]|uniref:Uncharacterized protein n=1 Tax=Melghirimyces profundicolus TaxID=1242148 RepID=A0A2T6BG70_9BACL|nr:hypothetical protein [Melghirimyces profundicolus]PTX55063.1 hypothetical protein C8P63_12223 [Melghirimyces profundicolus]
MKLWGVQVRIRDGQGNPAWQHPFIVKAKTGFEVTGKAQKRIAERAPVNIGPGSSVEIHLEWEEPLAHGQEEIMTRMDQIREITEKMEEWERKKEQAEPSVRLELEMRIQREREKLKRLMK